MFWLKYTENKSTIAQMASSHAIPMIAIMFASLGWHRANSATGAYSASSIPSVS
jgi:hypothetical protein